MQVGLLHSDRGGRLRDCLNTIISNNMLIAFSLLVNLNHFRLLRVVGKGAFGKVRIVERKDTGLTFALKYIRKEEGLLELQSSRAETAIADTCFSGPFGKRTEYNSRTENARALEPSVPLQFAIQFPGHGVHVSIPESTLITPY